LKVGEDECEEGEGCCICLALKAACIFFYLKVKTHEVGTHKKFNKHTQSKRPEEFGGTEKERNSTSNKRKGGRDTASQRACMVG
jgi:hypothetical protein